MRTTVIALTLLALSAPAASGETLHFTNIQNLQQIQEVATLISAISEAHGQATGPDFVVGGPPEQVALARWLMNELDRPVNDDPASGAFRVGPEYSLPVDTESSVRLFYLPFTKTVQEFQEAVTSVRSTTDIRWMFTVNAPRAVAVRGTADKCTLAEELFGELSKNTSENSAEFSAPNQRLGEKDDTIQILHVPHTSSAQDFQEVVTLTRSVGGIRQLFGYLPTRAMIVRGSPGHVGLAKWLAKQLDQPDSVSREYRLPEGDENIVRVLYVPQTSTVQEFQNVASSVRAQSGIKYLYTYNAPRALVVRGTSDQVALAQKLLQE
jgi:hypothetical protein